MNFEDDPFVDPKELSAANDRHDAEMRRLGFDVHARIRTGWTPGNVMRNGPLTDRKINKYVKAGYYSEEYRAFRKKNMQKKKPRRVGNYLEYEGKLIYNP